MASEREPLPESPQIPARTILVLLGIGAVLIGLSMAGLGGYYAHRARGLAAPAFDAFPAPQLETALQRIPRPAPSAPRPAPRAVVPIDRAMAMVAARGARAYDPPEGAAP